MAIGGIDHINIRTRDLPGTIAFYRDVLHMQQSESMLGDQGAFMLDRAGRAAVHLGHADAYGEGPPEGPTGAVDHVAFECSDYDAMRAQLERLGLIERMNDIPSFGLRQLFVRDPNGVLLELNFREAVAPAA